MRQPTRFIGTPSTGAALFVGNARCATSIENLDSVCEGCRRIVFCQDGDGTMAFQHDPAFQYLAFPIGRWRTVLPSKTPEAAGAFFTAIAEEFLWRAVAEAKALADEDEAVVSIDSSHLEACLPQLLLDIS